MSLAVFAPEPEAPRPALSASAVAVYRRANDAAAAWVNARCAVLLGEPNPRFLVAKERAAAARYAVALGALRALSPEAAHELEGATRRKIAYQTACDQAPRPGLFLGGPHHVA